MKIAITGHMNIEKCFGITQNNNHIYDESVFIRVSNTIEEYLRELCLVKRIKFNDLELISGMARGVDEIFAKIAMDNNLKLVICVPKSVDFHHFKVDYNNPTIKIQAIEYDNILEYDRLEIIEVDDNFDQGNYWYFLARNQSMVDISDFVISFSCYDSEGTQDCIQRAKKQNKYLENVEINK